MAISKLGDYSRRPESLKKLVGLRGEEEAYIYYSQRALLRDLEAKHGTCPRIAKVVSEQQAHALPGQSLPDHTRSSCGRRRVGLTHSNKSSKSWVRPTKTKDSWNNRNDSCLS